MPNYAVLELNEQEGVAELAQALREATVDGPGHVQFVNAPQEYLAQRGIGDVLVQVGDVQVSVYALLESVEPAARDAVARTIATRVRPAPAKAAEVHPNVVIPFANAAIVANAFMYANANVIVNANVSMNANVGANANVRGMAELAAESGASYARRRLTLSEEYLASAVHDVLGAQGYSEVREAALIKSLLSHVCFLDEQPGVQRIELESNGLQFEIDIAVDINESIVVLGARLVTDASAAEAAGR